MKENKKPFKKQSKPVKSLSDLLQKKKKNFNNNKEKKNYNENKLTTNKWNNNNNNNNSNKYVKKRKIDSHQSEEDNNTNNKKKNIRRERQAQKPNFLLVEDLKRFWNLAREKTISTQERDTKIAQIVTKMRGNILQVTLRHDASRAVQCILQFGTNEQRRLILNEMAERFYEIAKTPYGHFVVLKAITYCTEESERTLIINSLRGHFVSLGTNVIGARTVETLLQLWPKKLTKSLKAEFYGHKFLLTLSESPNGLKFIMDALPNKRDSLLDHMRDLVQRFVDKSLLEFGYVHSLLWEYASECIGVPTRLNDLVNLLSDSAPKLISTKLGSKVMCIVINNATAKDRKKIMKSLKGHVLESLLHDSGHLAIMRLIDVTDDTVNVQRMLLDEIMNTKPTIKYSASGELIGDQFPPLIQIIKHQFGRKFLLRLLSPNKRHLEPDEESLFTLESIAPQTSKKNPLVRRHEHLTYLRLPLLQVVSQYLHYLVLCPTGCPVLFEVISTYFPIEILNKIILTFSGTYEILDTLNEAQSKSLEDNNASNQVDDDNDDDDDDEVNEEEEEEEVNEEDENQEEEEEEEETYKISDLELALKEDNEAFGEDNENGNNGNNISSSNKIKKDLIPLPDLTNIEENPIAQLLLKKILNLQATFETQENNQENNDNENMESIEKTLWEKVALDNSDDNEVYFPFALRLIESLFSENLDNQKILSWIERNRPAFILSDIMKVPSAKNTLSKLLKPFKKQIKATIKTSAGGKHLLEQVEKK